MLYLLMLSPYFLASLSPLTLPLSVFPFTLAPLSSSSILIFSDALISSDAFLFLYLFPYSVFHYSYYFSFLLLHSLLYFFSPPFCHHYLLERCIASTVCHIFEPPLNAELSLRTLSEKNFLEFSFCYWRS